MRRSNEERVFDLKRIIVRRLEELDLEARMNWLNSEEIYANVPIDVPVSLNDTKKWFSQNALNQSRKDFAFVIDEEQGQSLISMSGLVGIDYRNRRAELYMFMNPKFIARGLGTLVLRWLCNYGFTEMGLNKIFLFTVESNSRARTFYERNAFVLEGTLKKHQWHRGKFVDRFIHGLLFSDWKEQTWATEAPPSFEIPILDQK